MSIIDLIKRLFHRIWSDEETIGLVKNNDSIPSFTTNFEGRIEVVSLQNINDSQAFESESYTNTYRDMISKGDKVIFGYVGDRCVYRLCVQMSGIIKFDGCPVKELQDKEAYIHYVFCDELYRGKGFHSAVINYTCKLLSDYTLYVCVKENNKASLSGIYKNGFINQCKIHVKNRFLKRKVYIEELK